MRPIPLDNHRARLEAKRDNHSSPLLPRAEILYLLETYFKGMREALDSVPMVDLARAAEELLRAKVERKTVYVLGNGGSAATASHAAADWPKPNKRDDSGGLRTVSLVDNIALLTAWANDISFDEVFAAQLQTLLQPGDVVIAVSGSGESPNVLRAVETAREAGAVTIGFSGFDGGSLSRMVDISAVVPCGDQKTIEDIHLALVHALSVVLRQAAAASADSDVEVNEAVRSMAI